jgi:hypothetical protein
MSDRCPISGKYVPRKNPSDGYLVLSPEGEEVRFCCPSHKTRYLRENPGSVEVKRLKPSDKLLVYHGTRLAFLPQMIHGFDATQEVKRYYGGPRHTGVFVAPDFETARRFGPIVMEIEVRAANLHGTDYSGVTGREEPRREEIWRSFYPDSFRPYLSETLTAVGEPQALLKGLVSPRAIKRVWVTPPGEEETTPLAGRWFSRKELLSLGMESTKPPGGGRTIPLTDLGVDVAYPNYSYNEFIEALVRLFDSPRIDRARVEGTLQRRARMSQKTGNRDVLTEVIEQAGFAPQIAQRYADRFRLRLSAEQNPGSVEVNPAQVHKRDGETYDSVATKIDGQRVVLTFFRSDEDDAPDVWNVALLVGATRKEKKSVRLRAEWVGPESGRGRGRVGLKALVWAKKQIDIFQEDYPDATVVVGADDDRRARAYNALTRAGFHLGRYAGERVLFRGPSSGRKHGRSDWRYPKKILQRRSRSNPMRVPDSGSVAAIAQMEDVGLTVVLVDVQTLRSVGLLESIVGVIGISEYEADENQWEDERGEWACIVSFAKAESGYGPLLYDLAAYAQTEIDPRCPGIFPSDIQSKDAERFWRRQGTEMIGPLSRQQFQAKYGGLDPVSVFKAGKRLSRPDKTILFDAVDSFWRERPPFRSNPRRRRQ